MKKLLFLAIVITVFSGRTDVFAHCEIPCGIYGDQMRVDMLQEHITTLETSITMINGLLQAKEKDYNQIVRWINNKEEHAQKIQEVVWQYFMTQRIKPAGAEQKEAREKYLKEITLLHKMLIAAMKAKQGTDLRPVEDLKELLREFAGSYLGTEKETQAH